LRRAVFRRGALLSIHAFEEAFTMQFPINETAPPELSVTRRLPKDKRESIETRFRKFHAAHPEIYDLLVKLSRDVRRRGVKQYGMKAVFERARWHYVIEKGDRKFGLCNDFTAPYARLIMANEPDLRGFFTIREPRRKNLVEPVT
jgi:hypothetical protein